MIVDKPFKLFKVTKSIGSVRRAQKHGKAQKMVAIHIARAGANGTGQTLPYLCGFCKDKDGRPTAAFRSAKERRRHANTCPK